MLKRIKYLILPTEFKCSIVRGRVSGSGRINQRQLSEFAELARHNSLDNLRIYGVFAGGEIRLDFSGKLTEGQKQRFKNLWQIIK